MYSRNDYRYYLENRLMHSDDFLAHYGVKGMKWKNHKSMSLYDDTVSGQLDKAYDKHIAKSNARKLINKTNPYKWSDNRTIDQNIERNVRTAKRRRKLKKVSNKAVDALYGPVNFKVKKSGKKKKTSKGNVIITERKNQKTGEKTTRNPKVEIVTSKDHKKKRSKREAKWNRKMQNYGREALKEIQ